MALALRLACACYQHSLIVLNLRLRLRHTLARTAPFTPCTQVVDLQVDVSKKDVRITQLMDQKAELEKKIGMTMGDRKSGKRQLSQSQPGICNTGFLSTACLSGAVLTHNTRMPSPCFAPYPRTQCAHTNTHTHTLPHMPTHAHTYACAEYVTMAEYEDLQLEVTGLKDQLIGCLEELASREKEAAELHDTSLRYHSKMQTFSDQVGRRRCR